MKNYLSKSLYHWLAVSTNSETTPRILSCSDTTIQLAASAAQTVQVGHIFIHIDDNHPTQDLPNLIPVEALPTMAHSFDVRSLPDSF